MILIIGGTGFIGQALVRRLTEAGHPVRLLIRPSLQSPQLPIGTAVEAAVTQLEDERGLRSAMSDVDIVYHLAGGEWRGARADLLQSDIQTTRAVSQAAADSRVKRLFYISHLDAERAAGYPVLKAKGIAEEYIRSSGVAYTILRSSVVFGKGDHFTTGLAKLLYALPFVFLVPGNGQVMLQPLWVEDLATCLLWALDDDQTRNQVIDIGGPEYLSFNQILAMVMERIRVRRKLVNLAPAYLRLPTIFLENALPALPISIYWLDYLAANRICELDTVPRIFQLMPSRLSQCLDYLQSENWDLALWRTVFRPQRRT
ncbi:MAG: SDR family oxidoreductase [Chloroflexota bacterium]